MADGRKKSVETLVKQLNKQFKTNKAGVLSDFVADFNKAPDVIPTGLGYDMDESMLEIGGLARGRIIEISGTPSGGKSLIAYRAIAAAQRMGEIAALFDAEQCCRDVIGSNWLRKQGVDTDSLVYSTEVIAEHVLKMVYDLAMSGDVPIIVVDSVPSLIPLSVSLEAVEGQKKQPKGFKQDVAPLARIMSPALAQISKAAAEGNCCVVFINQLREKPGVMYGDPTDTPGGKALKFYAALRMRVAKKSNIVENGQVVGIMSNINIVKSKVSTAGKKTGEATPGPLSIYYDGRVVTPVDSLFVLGVETGIIEKKGNTYTFNQLSAVGKEKFKTAIEEGGLVDALAERIKDYRLVAPDDNDPSGDLEGSEETASE